jgi:hypothetical protein
MGTPRLARALAYAWVVLLSMVVLGPALGPGFVLSYDLVFTPRQDLLPTSLGVGGGLPRAVPQDAVVAILETVIPGGLLEKLVLLAIPILVGTGMLRLLPGTVPGVVAATLAIANPFVAQRLIMGHWGFLLAYALVPWALAVSGQLRRTGDVWAGVRLFVIVAAASLTPSGSLLISAVAVPPALLPGSAYAPVRRGLLAAAVAALWLPWLLPALLSPASGVSDPLGTRVFALRADGPGGDVVSALTGGGIWNAEAVLPSRESPLAWVFAVTLLALAAWGGVALWRALGRAVVGWWLMVAVAGLVAALASSLTPTLWSAILEATPGGGLARDSHKLLAPWMLLVAAAAGLGAARLAGLARDRTARIAIAGALVVVPIACQPDLLWGAGGRLTAVAYPAEWSRVRDAMLAQTGPGDVVSFPWTAFRRFPWNDGRTVLDPAPRWMPRITVVSDTLDIETADGLVAIGGDDPRAEAISAVVAGTEQPEAVQPEAAASFAELLTDLGIGWALVARDTPGPVPRLPGWALVVDGPSLGLYAAPTGQVRPRTPDAGLVSAVDAAVGGAVVLALGALAWNGIRRVRARGRPGLVR